MNSEELYDWCIDYLKENQFIDFPEKIFNNITVENSKFLVQKLGKNTLMKLPSKEIKFFEWLKEKDLKIWEDLWDSEDEEYIVALNFLPYLLEPSRGFPICDLIHNDNYYFTSSMFIDKVSQIFIDSVQQMYKDKQTLTVEQTLALEISIAPIDIWRFCYRYNIDIERAKKAVQNLIEDGIIIHLKKSEQLADFIEW